MRILIVKMSSLGDIIQCWPVAVALRSAFPKAHISWAVHDAFSHIVPEKPYVDEQVIVDRKSLYKPSYLRQLAHRLQAVPYDVVLDLQGILKSALVVSLSGARTRYVYSDAKEGSWLFARRVQGAHATGHVVERYLDVVRAWCSHEGIATPIAVHYPTMHWPSAQERITRRLHEEGIPSYYAYAIATRWSHKDWPASYFAALASQLWRTTGRPSLLLGSAADKERGSSILAEATPGAVIDWTGTTTLEELFATIQQAHLFVGGDSGPMHFANAMQKPLVALFGATYPSRSGPYGNAQARVLVSETAPQDVGQLANKKANVMWGLSPETVFDTILQLEEEVRDA